MNFRALRGKRGAFLPLLKLHVGNCEGLERDFFKNIFKKFQKGIAIVKIMWYNKPSIR